MNHFESNMSADVLRDYLNVDGYDLNKKGKMFQSFGAWTEKPPVTFGI